MLSLKYLAALHAKYERAATATVQRFTLRGAEFDFAARPHLMGVINLSADSWYRESVCLSVESAIRRGLVLAAQGADLVDLGAESTLAHAVRADAALQQSKLLPVVRALAEKGVRISVETYEPAVARACFEAGACVLNLTGNLEDDELYRIAAAHEGAVILCYVQGRHVRVVGDFHFAEDLVDDMYEYFARHIERATKNGVTRLFVDPGLGFYYKNLGDSSRRIRHQLEVFLHTFRLRTLGWPTCHALPHAFEHFGEEVRSAESLFAVMALLGRTDLLRTHELPRVRAVLATLGELT
jgi:dihydropteroate synthase